MNTMATILIILTCVVLYLLVGLTTARLILENEIPLTPEEQTQQDFWYVVITLAFPVAFVVCCIITLKDIINEFREGRK